MGQARLLVLTPRAQSLKAGSTGQILSPFLRQRPTRKSGSQRAARNPREASHEPHDRLSHKTYVPRLLCPFALGCDCLGSHGIARAGNLEPSPSTVVGSSDFGRGCTGVAALDCRACAHCISEARTPGVRPIIAPVSFAAALLRSFSAPQLVTIGKPPPNRCLRLRNRENRHGFA